MGEGKKYRWEGEGKREGVGGREMIQKTDEKGTRNRRDVAERKRYRRWMGRGWAAGERWRGGEIHKKAEGGGREVGEGRRWGRTATEGRPAPSNCSRRTPPGGDAPADPRCLRFLLRANLRGGVALPRRYGRPRFLSSLQDRVTDEQQKTRASPACVWAHL